MNIANENFEQAKSPISKCDIEKLYVIFKYISFKPAETTIHNHSQY